METISLDNRLPCADRGPEVVEKIDKNKGSLKAVLDSLLMLSSPIRSIHTSDHVLRHS
jgi:hypothetical protein